MAKGEASKANVPEKAPAAASTGRTEPEARVEQTPVAPQPQAGTSQNPPPIPSIPLDTVMKLLQALVPGVNVEGTLAQLVTLNQPTPNPQTTTIPTPQPSPELTTPNPVTMGKSTEVVESEAEKERKEREETETQVEEVGVVGGVVEGITEGEVVVDKEMLADGERELKTMDGISEEFNILGSGSSNEMVRDEEQSLDNEGTMEGDWVIGYTKDTALGTEGWESAIDVPETTPPIKIEGRILAALPQFPGKGERDPWGTLNRFLAVCWNRERQVGISEEIFRLVTFPFCLAGDALEWFKILAPGSITTWLELRTAFLRKFSSRDDLDAPAEAWFNWSIAKTKWAENDHPNEEDMPTLEAEIAKFKEANEQQAVQETCDVIKRSHFSATRTCGCDTTNVEHGQKPDTRKTTGR